MRFQIHHSTTSCLPNTCIILNMIIKLKIFVTFFSGITIQGFLKFGFRVYLSQLLYRMMRFQIYHLTTSCLPNTCMILHIIAKLKIFVSFFSGITIQGFLKYGFRIYTSQVTYTVWCVFRFITQQLPVYRTLECMILHMIAKLKILSHFSQELQYKDFWNLVSLFIQVSYTVWCVFRFITQQLPVYRTLA